MVLGVGYVAEQGTDGRVYENTKSWASVGIREFEFLTILEVLLAGGLVTEAASPGTPTQDVTSLATDGMMRLAKNSRKGQSDDGEATADYSWWFKRLRFAQIMQADTHRVLAPVGVDADGKGKDPAAREAARLATASSLQEAVGIVLAALSAKVARAIMISVEDVESSRPLSRYGVDSLMAWSFGRGSS